MMYTKAVRLTSAGIERWDERDVNHPIHRTTSPKPLTWQVAIPVWLERELDPKEV